MKTQLFSLLQSVIGHDEKPDTLFAHQRAEKMTAGDWITKTVAQQLWGQMPADVRGPKARAHLANRRQTKHEELGSTDKSKAERLL